MKIINDQLALQRLAMLKTRWRRAWFAHRGEAPCNCVVCQIQRQLSARMSGDAQSADESSDRPPVLN